MPTSSQIRLSPVQRRCSPSHLQCQTVGAGWVRSARNNSTSCMTDGKPAIRLFWKRSISRRVHHPPVSFQACQSLTHRFRGPITWWGPECLRNCIRLKSSECCSMEQDRHCFFCCDHRASPDIRLVLTSALDFTRYFSAVADQLWSNLLSFSPASANAVSACIHRDSLYYILLSLCSVSSGVPFAGPMFVPLHPGSPCGHLIVRDAGDVHRERSWCPVNSESQSHVLLLRATAPTEHIISESAITSGVMSCSSLPYKRTASQCQERG